MLFSTPIFLFWFLPLLLAAYFLAPRGMRNGLLLAASLLFYAWGERKWVAVLLASIAVNYLVGRALDGAAGLRRRRLMIGLAVAVNLGLLAVFKYADFFVDNLNPLLAACRLGPLPRPGVHLPLGISFFTFHALSYVLDVYTSPSSRRALPAPSSATTTWRPSSSAAS
jgi:alginate O-acetyltransferase complex protein AlgI